MAHTNITTGQLVADYTMLYKDYKETFGALDLSVFPTVEINGETFNMAAMFEARNEYKEIGAETPELFRAIANRRIREAALLFNSKINEWSSHLSDLWTRETKEEESTVDDYFVNPTVSATSAAAPKLQSTSKSTYKHHIVFGQGVSNTEMLEQILELDNIFFTALTSLDNLFMTIY